MGTPQFGRFFRCLFKVVKFLLVPDSTRDCTVVNLVISAWNTCKVNVILFAIQIPRNFHASDNIRTLFVLMRGQSITARKQCPPGHLFAHRARRSATGRQIKIVVCTKGRDTYKRMIEHRIPCDGSSIMPGHGQWCSPDDRLILTRP